MKKLIAAFAMIGMLATASATLASDTKTEGKDNTLQAKTTETKKAESKPAESKKAESKPESKKATK